MISQRNYCQKAGGKQHGRPKGSVNKKNLLITETEWETFQPNGSFTLSKSVGDSIVCGNNECESHVAKNRKVVSRSF